MRKSEYIKALQERLSPQLKPCRYCGNTNPQIDKIRFGDGVFYTISCDVKGCGDFVRAKRIKDAVSKWNGEKER